MMRLCMCILACVRARACVQRYRRCCKTRSMRKKQLLRVVPQAHLCVRLRNGCWVLGRAVVPLASLAIGILPPDQVTAPLVLCLC